ncbi:MAG: CD1871A family CXXC motif-containing protein [Bacillota bacterium]|nr:CD1871A family CXXC motif-containing protein [Bacillota bacterium]
MINHKMTIRQLSPEHILTRRFVMASGVALLLIGLLRGEARLVLQRAIQICLGCIGIG